jgi:hypothetical protein
MNLRDDEMECVKVCAKCARRTDVFKEFMSLDVASCRRLPACALPADNRYFGGSAEFLICHANPAATATATAPAAASA